MKKKGLIISTVVMVVVLIASLTTATYAWFSTSSNTSISGFDVTVTSNNAINIGLKGETYNNGTSPDEFVSGTCAYVQGTDKVFGHWTGSTSLAPTIDDTGVYWGTQSKAVGFNEGKITAKDATYSNVGFFPSITGDFNGTAIAANGSSNTLTSAELATINGSKDDTTTTYGNYAYLFIGAKPIKAVQANTNKFYVVVQPQGSGTAIGMAAAVHVAFRTKLSGADTWTAWKDVDVWSQSETESQNKHYGDARNSSTVTIIGDYSTSDYKLQNATKVTPAEGSGDPVKTSIVGAQVLTIDLSEYTSTNTEAGIDQIEMVIYLAGKDSDCVDSAKNGTTFIGLFFGAQEVK